MKLGRPNAALLKVWLFALVFLPITLNLGFWQLDRADEKASYLQDILKKEQQPLSVWQSVSKAEQVVFQPFELIGHYQDQSFLLDNRIRDGLAGYEVLTPFKLFTGELVLVNRGWVQAGKYRQDLPDIISPKELVTLQGYFYQLQGEVPVLKEVPEERSWPRRVQQIEWPILEQTISSPFTERLEFRLGHDEQPGAYRTGWPKTRVMPEKHLGYAYQWFGLSIALLVLTLLATVKIKKSDHRSDRENKNN